MDITGEHQIRQSKSEAESFIDIALSHWEDLYVRTENNICI